jgi:hypothetical protein
VRSCGEKSPRQRRLDVKPCCLAFNGGRKIVKSRACSVGVLRGRQVQRCREKRGCSGSNNKADLEVRRIVAILCLCIERQPESISIWTAKLAGIVAIFRLGVSVACIPDRVASHDRTVHLDRSNVSPFMR